MMSSGFPPRQSDLSRKLDTDGEPGQLEPDLAYLLINALSAYISYVDAQQRYRFVNQHDQDVVWRVLLVLHDRSQALVYQYA
ncbi:MAG: hypothetical protein N4J56_006828 [Chroococcidiopsis sp. SAG 2025]|uniref:hypothetical protein n=1 Tax=Chroococcidiopsis sp. SAG 2025 TaxID=171389 RepID=UPI00293718FF|nr:hypothetical protein [Chroococcidiopsis sp. SAG 2025]MDV2997123.1 hypothetical protein [Chroococcidiopsis sp. SAG 2025]